MAIVTNGSRAEGSRLALEKTEYVFLYLTLSHLLHGVQTNDQVWDDVLGMSRVSAERMLASLAASERVAQHTGRHWNPRPGSAEDSHEDAGWSPLPSNRRAEFNDKGVMLSLSQIEFKFILSATDYVLHRLKLSDNDFRVLLGVDRAAAKGLLEVLKSSSIPKTPAAPIIGR